MRGARRGIVGGVPRGTRILGVLVTPEHVALQVDVREVDEGGVARLEAVEREVDHPPGIFLDQPDLLDVFVIVEDAVLERIRFFRHALGVEEIDAREDRFDEIVGARDRHEGRGRRNVDR